MTMSHTLYEKVIDDISKDLDTWGGGEPQRSILRIGRLITVSAILFHEIKINELNVSEKIVRSYSLFIDNINYLGYETNEGNIYMLATPYGAYWGYFDNHMTFHHYHNSNDVFGFIPDIDKVITTIKNLKKRDIFHKLTNKFCNKNVVLVFNVKNLGHHIWNEQAGIDFYSKIGLIEKINKVLFNIDYFNMAKWFSNKYKLHICNSKTNNMISNDILVGFFAKTYRKVTSERLLQYCLDNSKKHYDVLNKNNINIIVCLRTNQRIWKEENSAWVKILNELVPKYNINVIFDGFSSPAAGKISKENIKSINFDKKQYKEILSKLSTNVRKKTFCIIGMDCVDKICIYNSAKLLIMPYGSTEHFNWIVQKEKISYGPKCAAELSKILHSHYILSGVHIEEIAIPSTEIIEYENADYSLDYNVVKNILEKKLKDIYRNEL